MLGDDEKASNPLKWQGLNKLGFALMVVRDKILEEWGFAYAILYLNKRDLDVTK